MLNYYARGSLTRIAFYCDIAFNVGNWLIFIYGLTEVTLVQSLGFEMKRQKYNADYSLESNHFYPTKILIEFEFYEKQEQVSIHHVFLFN